MTATRFSVIQGQINIATYRRGPKELLGIRPMGNGNFIAQRVFIHADARVTWQYLVALCKSIDRDIDAYVNRKPL